MLWLAHLHASAAVWPVKSGLEKVVQGVQGSSMMLGSAVCAWHGGMGQVA